jgi:hypothetical protein
LKCQTDREYFLERFTQFSKGNNLQDTAASNLYHILPRDTCVSSDLQYRPILHRMKSHLKMLTDKEYSLERAMQFSKGNNVWALQILT